MWAPLTKMSYAGTAYRTLPEHLSSPLVFSVVRVIRYLVLYVCFVDRCLSFCTFSFGHCVVCSSSIYGFRLPLWYLQTLLWLSIVSNSLALHTWILSSETKIKLNGAGKVFGDPHSTLYIVSDMSEFHQRWVPLLNKSSLMDQSRFIWSHNQPKIHLYGHN